jgi:phosphoribosylformylglycinamidine synthase II
MTTTATVQRIEIRPNPDQPDPVAQQALEQARQRFGMAVTMQSARIFLIQGDLDDACIEQITQQLLADPINQSPTIGAAAGPDYGCIVEVHYKPGVMDPVAQSTRDAIQEMTGKDVEVRTGFRYDIFGTGAPPEDIEQFAQAALANTVIQDIYHQPFHPDQFTAGAPYQLRLTHVPIRDLDDDALTKLSREAHLFLSLEEMRAVRDYYRELQRDPTDIELETLAQTWSEHCVHKTLKSTIRYTGDPIPNVSGNREGHAVNDDGSITIDNLLKRTIAAATFRLMSETDLKDWCISVFEDNAGIVRFDETHGVCIKVETHNHPSAIEPYGGAATGIGGCIRDVIGTGLAAQPFANTDVFCIAPPDSKSLPAGVIHPKRVLQQVVAGVRDYGNRMGIPTVNGAVWFHDDYLGNPLVYCGCVGLLPLDKCFGDAAPGDRIIVLGGRTGRDGIHGATFSSSELTDSHADEFSHAVQIGNAITEKTTLDVIIQARDYEPSGGGCLFSAITDCGAGGFSSAVGEMGEKVGAHVTLETAPLKYDGLSYTEIWISEAQERMVLAVPPQNVAAIAALCEAEDVQMCDLGYFGNTDESSSPLLTLTYKNQQVGELSMNLLHHGIPTPTREATWTASALRPAIAPTPTEDIGAVLRALLSHPNIASKHWIIRQYDHEVQGGSVVKPLVGPQQDGPADAAVVRPKLDSQRGIALGCGLQTGMSETFNGDSYWMVLAAIDEAVRNLVCVGGDPTHIAILDNFCWPSCDDPRNLGSLVRASEACYDGAMAYKTPFVSGKDSLNNQFTTEDGKIISVPPTMLITAMGIVPDTNKCITMDAKSPGNVLIIVGNTSGEDLPRTDLTAGPANAAAVAALIENQLVASAHDCSDGGLLVAAAEMAFAGRVGLDIDLQALPSNAPIDSTTACFAESPSRYLLEITPKYFDAAVRSLRDAGVPFAQIGRFDNHERLTLRTAQDGQLLDESLDTLRQTWRSPLDW